MIVLCLCEFAIVSCDDFYMGELNNCASEIDNKNEEQNFENINKRWTAERNRIGDMTWDPYPRSLTYSGLAPGSVRGLIHIVTSRGRGRVSGDVCT